MIHDPHLLTTMYSISYSYCGIFKLYSTHLYNDTFELFSHIQSHSGEDWGIIDGSIYHGTDETSINEQSG